jgi:abortive infection bacteriophage resistance protein
MSVTPPARGYVKPWLSCSDQVALLQSRGLTVLDPTAAAAFLSHVNYYRFSGYCLAFETTRHAFLSGVAFEQVRASYDFDRVLRDLVTEALEVVEVDFRTAIAHRFGHRRGPFGHTHATAFFRRFAHADWLTKLRDETDRSHEPFVIHYRMTYAEYPDLPVWMATEIMSFGALSLMFKGMLRVDQRDVAARYRLQPTHLASLMHHSVYVRNLCAHHSRLWDRVWAIKPDLPPGKAWRPPLLPGNDRLFATVLTLYELLKRCPAVSPFDEEWRDRLHAHLASPPEAPRALERMGLTDGWKAHPAWA